jgi:hypothetical protein
MIPQKESVLLKARSLVKIYGIPVRGELVEP